ncbi:unnamed protein product [Phytophthora fragariaefolia]|uniref:Unnamed protein product n=1 Tax=Phytophthora fragariaefolia TaxID=1490495 RepID=A0A9W7CQP2_9STRA|nr:unnamed protein product [Phytophthora fragariaefolia]
MKSAPRITSTPHSGSDGVSPEGSTPLDLATELSAPGRIPTPQLLTRGADWGAAAGETESGGDAAGDGVRRGDRLVVARVLGSGTSCAFPAVGAAEELLCSLHC